MFKESSLSKVLFFRVSQDGLSEERYYFLVYFSNTTFYKTNGNEIVKRTTGLAVGESETEDVMRSERYIPFNIQEDSSEPGFVLFRFILWKFSKILSCFKSKIDKYFIIRYS